MEQKRRGLKKYGMRKCLGCKKILELNFGNFFRNNTGKGAGGFQWYCKKCQQIRNKRYYQTGRLKKRFDFLKRFNFTCQYCGRKAPEVVFHVDHVVPVSKGGGDEEKNLVLACDECNIGKGNKMLDII